jgi:arylsulfatase A-like enzyme
MVAGSRIFPTLPRASTGVRGAAPLALLVLFGVTGCAKQDAPPSPGKSAAARPAIVPTGPTGGSVLILTLDTTRRDFMGFLGHAPTLTPRLDALAAESVVFEDAYTVAPLTLPAHASLMTGLYPLSHHLRDNGIAALPGGANTLARTLAAAGYRTGASVASFVLDACFGLDQGFSIWHEPPRAPGRADLYMAELPADRMVDRALEDLRTMEGPFLYWLHLFDAHFPYTAPGSRPPSAAPANAAEVRAETRRRYGEEIAFVDREVGRLLDALRMRPGFDRLTIVVAADHGEALGDGREETHGYFLYDPTVRIPLLIRHPGAPPHRVAAQVSLVDVMPTLLDLLGVDAGALRFDGASVADLVRGTGEVAPERTIALESWYGYANFGWAPLEACVAGPLKFQRARVRRLFDRDADPLERTNLWSADEPRARALERRLDALAAGPAAALSPHGIELDEAGRAALARLGYVDAHQLDLVGRPDAAHLDEVEEHLEEIALLEAINTAHMAGAPDEAVRIARALAKRLPGSVAVHEQLASLLLLVRTPEALDDAEHELQKAVALDFRRSKNHYNLGLVAMRRAALARQPADVDAQFEKAAAEFARALELDATQPEALANLAGVRRRQLQRLPESAPDFHAERVRRLREILDLYRRFLAVIPAGHADRAAIESARDEAQRLLSAEGGP